MEKDLFNSTNMKILISFLLILSIGLVSCGTSTGQMKHVKAQDPDFEARLTDLLSFSVPLISVEELKSQMDEVTIFDAREEEEYNVSHIPGADWIGYETFDISDYEELPRESPIVLYCSVGYRSEKIGERLTKAGFTNVFNLYGSIFEWVNLGNKVVDVTGKESREVHTYNEKWSRWMLNEEMRKVW